MSLIYISGPYTKNEVNGKTQEENINQARKISCELMEIGHFCHCPHLNTAYFEDHCNLTYDQYIAGDLNLLSRCDIIVMTEDWESSKGAKIERDHAIRLGIPVYVYPILPKLSNFELDMPTWEQAIRERHMGAYRKEIDMHKNGNFEIGVVHKEELSEMVL